MLKCILKKMLQVFIYTIAGITICAAIFISLIIPDAILSYHLLWQIIITSALSALGNLLYLSKKEIGKKQMIFRMIIYYIYINIIVIGSAIRWEWISPRSITQILFLLLLIAVVYIIITLIMMKKEKKIAENINSKLTTLNSSEEESE